MEYIVLNGENLSLDQFIQGVRERKQVMLSEEAEIKVIKARETVQRALNSKRVVYGLTTGFGALSDVVISKNQAKQLQRNILMSHAAGVGNYLDEEISRATLLLKINNLAKGHAGIKLETLKTVVEMYNKGIYPLMPEKVLSEPVVIWRLLPIWRWFWWGRDRQSTRAEFAVEKLLWKRRVLIWLILMQEKGWR